MKDNDRLLRRGRTRERGPDRTFQQPLLLLTGEWGGQLGGGRESDKQEAKYISLGTQRQCIGSDERVREWRQSPLGGEDSEALRERCLEAGPSVLDKASSSASVRCKVSVCKVVTGQIS